MKACFQAVLIGALLVMPACARSDAGISSAVKAKLIADDTVKAGSIDVETQGRVVTLSGRVSTKEQEAKAIKLARGTSGVRFVESRLRIAPEPPTVATSGSAGDTSPTDKPAGDAGITANIKARLLADPLVNGLDVDVDTHDRLVTLTGKVPSEAAKQRAVEIARRVDAVAGVEDKLTVQAPFPPR